MNESNLLCFYRNVASAQGPQGDSNTLITCSQLYRMSLNTELLMHGEQRPLSSVNVLMFALILLVCVMKLQNINIKYRNENSYVQYFLTLLDCSNMADKNHNGHLLTGSHVTSRPFKTRVEFPHKQTKPGELFLRPSFFSLPAGILHHISVCRPSSASQLFLISFFLYRSCINHPVRGLLLLTAFSL